MRRDLVKIDDQPLGGAEEIRIGAQQRFDLGKSRPHGAGIAVPAVQRDAMRRAVREHDVPQDDAAAVRQAHGAQTLQSAEIHPVEHDPDPVLFVRLAQIIAGVDRIAFAGVFVAGGAEHDAHVAVRFARFFGHVHAGQRAHEDVEDDQIERARPPRGKERFAVGKAGELHGPAQLFLDARLQLPAYGGIVVDDRDLQGDAPPFAGSRRLPPVAPIIPQERRNAKGGMHDPGGGGHFSVIGGMKSSIAPRSLGWRITKWIAGALPLDTIAHCPSRIRICRLRKAWFSLCLSV